MARRRRDRAMRQPPARALIPTVFDTWLDSLAAFETRYSWDFDGTDEGVDLGPIQSELSQASIVIWYKPYTITLGDYLFHSSNLKWAAAPITAGTSYRCFVGSVANYRQYATPTVETWTCDVIVFDGTLAEASRLAIYRLVDGAFSALSLTPAGTIPAAIPTLVSQHVARDSAGGNGFDGRIADMSFWSIPLSEAERAELIDASAKPADLAQHSAYASCLAWYRFGDGAGDDVTSLLEDQTANGNDGTPTNLEAGDLVEDAP